MHNGATGEPPGRLLAEKHMCKLSTHLPSMRPAALHAACCIAKGLPLWSCYNMLLTLLYFTCSTQQGVGTPIRSQRKAHRGLHPNMHVLM
jgi:hypothetical protein